MEDDDDTEIIPDDIFRNEEDFARVVAKNLPGIEAGLLHEAVTAEARAAGYARIGYADHAERILERHREQRIDQINLFSQALLTRWTRAVGEA